MNPVMNLQQQTGYEPFGVHIIRCKAKLPAAVWRSLAASERPYAHRDIAVVAIDDGDETAVAMPSRHYDSLLDRIHELEKRLGELVAEKGAE